MLALSTRETLGKELSRVGHRALDGGSGRSDWTGEESPAALALPAFKVPVRCACATLAGGQNIGVHAQTHAAAAAIEGHFVDIREWDLDDEIEELDI